MWCRHVVGLVVVTMTSVRVTFKMNMMRFDRCSFLDASKAFDRLVHSGLFIKLIERGIPKRMLDILVTWYDGLQCRVKWDGHLGNWFSISAGVRQGGILSPDFYNIYVDRLIFKLQSSDV